MKKELDEKLCADYPLIFQDRNKPMNQTAMCWGFSCGDGWHATLCETHAKEMGRTKRIEEDEDE